MSVVRRLLASATESRRRPFPWARPRHELLLLALVAAATITVISPVGPQDLSRMCLTRALAQGHLSADRCLSKSVDRAIYGGHLYSDKPPGLSALAVPIAVAVRLPPPARWHNTGGLRLWLVRALTGGVALLAAAFLVGRIGEGLAPRWGGISLVTFACGTLAVSLSVSNFAEVPAGAIAFGAFVLAWRGRASAAGLLAGAALLFEYQTMLISLLIGLYLLAQGVRPLVRFALGGAVGAVILALYNQLAFGSPFHLSYRYVAPPFSDEQHGGFFGIHSPSLHATGFVLFGTRGLLVNAPVLALAVGGLWLLWRRRYRAEALVCAAVTLLFLLVEFGYFDPLGGSSPGPRFFIPALPFLALGLPLAFQRWPRLTLTLGLTSVVASITVALTWRSAIGAPEVYPWSVLWQLKSLPTAGTASNIAIWVQETVFVRAGAGRLAGGGIVALAAIAAFALSAREGLLTRWGNSRPR